jgi:molybdopterin converting factor small subunit
MKQSNVSVDITFYGIIGEGDRWIRQKIDLAIGSTVEDALNVLIQQEPSLKSKFHEPLPLALKDYNILLNGKSISLPEDLKLKTRNGDEISIILPVAGG